MPGQEFWEILIKIEFSLHLIKSLVGATAAHEKWRNAEESNTKKYARDGSWMAEWGARHALRGETHSSRRACTRCARDMRIIAVIELLGPPSVCLHDACQACTRTISITCACCKYFCLFTKPRLNSSRLDSTKWNPDSHCQNTQLISARQYCLLAKPTSWYRHSDVQNQWLLKKIQTAFKHSTLETKLLTYIITFNLSS